MLVSTAAVEKSVRSMNQRNQERKLARRSCGARMRQVPPKKLGIVCGALAPANDRESRQGGLHRLAPQAMQGALIHGFRATHSGKRPNLAGDPGIPHRDEPADNTYRLFSTAFAGFSAA